MRNNLKIASHKLIIFTWKAIEAGVMNNLKRETLKFVTDSNSN